jgi:hypothetical protein
MMSTYWPRRRHKIFEALIVEFDHTCVGERDLIP